MAAKAKGGVMTETQEARKRQKESPMERLGRQYRELEADRDALAVRLAEAEEAPCWLTREEVGLAIDGVAMLVQPESGDEYRPLLRKLQAAYRASRKEQSE